MSEVLETLRKMLADDGLKDAKGMTMHFEKNERDALGVGVARLEKYEKLKKKHFRLENGFLELLNNRKKLKEWLEKRIEQHEKSKLNCKKEGFVRGVQDFYQRQLELKEVLGRLK